MKLTRRSEYSLLALIYLGRSPRQAWVPLARLAQAQGIPVRYLEHLVTAMCRAGMVESSKGQHGGYRLARDPTTITLAGISRLFDGALAPVDSVSRHFYQSTPIEREERVLSVLKEIRDFTAGKLEGTTLADIL